MDFAFSIYNRKPYN